MSGQKVADALPNMNCPKVSQALPKSYCLKVVTACPDWKRPYAEVTIKHYSTKEAAEEALRNIKEGYIDDYFYVDRDSNDDDEEFNYREKGMTVEKLDEMIENGKLAEKIYEDSYMDMEPFDAEVFEVVAET